MKKGKSTGPRKDQPQVQNQSQVQNAQPGKPNIHEKMVKRQRARFLKMLIPIVVGVPLIAGTTYVALNLTSEHKITYECTGVDSEWLKDHPFSTDNIPNTLRHSNSIKLNAPAIAGYTFKEWTIKYSNKSETVEDGKTYKFRFFDSGLKYKDVTIIANYKVNQYSISLDVGNGHFIGLDEKDSYDGHTYSISNGIGTTSYTCLDEPFKFPKAERTGYDFASSGYIDKTRNQYYEGCDTSLLRDFELEASWSLHQYPITYSFSGEGVEEFASGVINNNPGSSNYEEEVLLNDPYLKGYTFVGWYQNDSKVTKINKNTFPNSGQIDLVGKFEPVVYNITYVDNSNSNHSHLPTSYKRCSPDVPIPAIEPIGYTFNGWISSNVTIFTYKDKVPHNSTGDIVFTADVKLITYHIIYNYEGLHEGAICTNNNVVTYDYETDVVLEDLSVNGYIFNGFFDESGNKISKINKHTAVGDRTFTARFTPIEYTITRKYRINAIGALQIEKTNYYVYTDEFTLPDVSSDVRKFVGWEEISSHAMFFPGAKFGGGATGDYNLEAVWSFIGEGTDTDPYQIFDAEQLMNIKEMNKSYILKNDITIASNYEEIWEPVGTSKNAFNGKFDGNGKTVTVIVDANSYNNYNFTNYFGIFGYLGTNAYIHNFKVNGSVGSSTSRLTTQLFGVVAASNSGTIENITCTVPMYLSSNNGSQITVGGIAGNNISGYINNCNYGVTKIDVSTDMTPTLLLGGIVGYGSGGAITNCTASVNLIGKAKTYSYVGGIIGDRDLYNATRISFNEDPSINNPVAGSTSSSVINSYGSIGMSEYDNKNVVGKPVAKGSTMTSSSANLIVNSYYYVVTTSADGEWMVMCWIKYLGNNSWDIANSKNQIIYQ